MCTSFLGITFLKHDLLTSNYRKVEKLAAFEAIEKVNHISNVTVLAGKTKQIKCLKRKPIFMKQNNICAEDIVVRSTL